MRTPKAFPYAGEGGPLAVDEVDVIQSVRYADTDMQAQPAIHARRAIHESDRFQFMQM